MAIRNIVKIGDPILRKTSRKVVNFDKKLWTLLDDMKETLKEANGAGLAAVQVGILRRVVIVDIDDGKGLMELINPEIVETSEETIEAEEGCLSLPNQWGVVKRPKVVVVKAQNREGKWCLYKGEGMRARCFCHELDHLDGHVFTDFVTKMLTDDDIRRMRDERLRRGEN
ncbi:MAG: peptide deformylase [Acutalibacteraceae bacterium]